MFYKQETQLQLMYLYLLNVPLPVLKMKDFDDFSNSGFSSCFCHRLSVLNVSNKQKSNHNVLSCIVHFR